MRNEGRGKNMIYSIPGIAAVLLFLLLWVFLPLETNEKIGVTTAISTVALVFVTSVYAWYTSKMAKEMKKQRYDNLRPIIDIQFDTSYATFLGFQMSNIEELENQNCPCILHNIGAGPAVDIYSYSYMTNDNNEHIQEKCGIGTLKKDETTGMKNLSVITENSKHYLLIKYKDIFGRVIESRREINGERTNWKLGELKTGALEEGQNDQRSHRHVGGT
jgi:hypothetical protein